MSKKKVSGSFGKCTLNFVKTVKLLSKVAIVFFIPTNSKDMKVPVIPHPWQDSWFSVLLISVFLVCDAITLQFSSAFPSDQLWWASLHALLVKCIPFECVWSVCSQLLLFFKMGLYDLLLSNRISLHILDTISWSDCFWQMSSKFVVCYFIFLTVVFNKQVLILMNLFHLFFLFLLGFVLFVSKLGNLCLTQGKKRFYPVFF